MQPSPSPRRKVFRKEVLPQQRAEEKQACSWLSTLLLTSQSSQLACVLSYGSQGRWLFTAGIQPGNTQKGLKVAPSLLGEGKKYKSRLLQWHSWAKDLGASDRKKPWEDVGISRCGLKEIQGLVLDSEPIGPLQEWKTLGREIPERGKFPRDDCLLLTGTGTKTLFTVAV